MSASLILIYIFFVLLQIMKSLMYIKVTVIRICVTCIKLFYLLQNMVDFIS